MIPTQTMDEWDRIERRMLRMEAERIAIQENERTLTCAFCGHQYEPGIPTSNHEALRAHVAVCEQHPAAEFRRRAEAAEARLIFVIALNVELRRDRDEAREMFDRHVAWEAAWDKDGEK